MNAVVAALFCDIGGQNAIVPLDLLPAEKHLTLIRKRGANRLTHIVNLSLPMGSPAGGYKTRVSKRMLCKNGEQKLPLKEMAPRKGEQHTPLRSTYELFLK